MLGGKRAAQSSRGGLERRCSLRGTHVKSQRSSLEFPSDLRFVTDVNVVRLLFRGHHSKEHGAAVKKEPVTSPVESSAAVRRKKSPRGAPCDDKGTSELSRCVDRWENGTRATSSSAQYLPRCLRRR